MKADTDHHSGSESSSSSGSDDLHQSGMSSINTTTASGYTSLGQAQPHTASAASNNGYYNTARNTTPQANGNQGFSLNTQLGSSHGSGMHIRQQHPSPHHYSPHTHQDGRGFFLGAPSGYHGMTSHGGSPNEQDPFRQHHHHHHHPQEETNRKREVRLMKNREAARECRRKKKEYIKCLENRVAVLENQNKALIEELKSLKELYTGKSFVQPKPELL